MKKKRRCTHLLSTKVKKMLFVLQATVLLLLFCSVVQAMTDQPLISLSMKKAMETVPASGQNTQRTRSGRKGPDHFEWSNKKNEATSFEDMLNKFKQSSDEKMSALKKGLESKRGGFSRHGSGQSR